MITGVNAINMDRATSAEKSIELTTCEIRVALAEMRVRVLKHPQSTAVNGDKLVALAEMRVRVLKRRLDRYHV